MCDASNIPELLHRSASAPRIPGDSTDGEDHREDLPLRPETRSSPRWKAPAVAFAVAVTYVGILIAYSLGNSSENIDSRTPEPGNVLVYVDIGSVDGANYSLGARVSVYPAPDLLDINGFPVEDLVIDVSPTASNDLVRYEAGAPFGPTAVSLYSDGDIRSWPFDRYRVDSAVVRVFAEKDGVPSPIPADVVVTDSAGGWNIESGGTDHAAGETFEISVTRNTVSKVYDLAICAVLLALPSCALFVAVSTVRGRKKFQPPMVTWFAVMLFAVLPIRNLLPGAPPIGSWVDYALILWVVLGLVTAMVLYVRAWWREAP